MAEQLPLPLTHHPAWTFEAFIEGPNAEIVAHLKSAARGHSDIPLTLLVGAKGSGKSHLLNAVCQEANDSARRAAVLPLKELSGRGIQILEGLEDIDCVCLDDVDEVLGQTDWDLSLMMLCHQKMGRSNQLVMSLGQPVGRIVECLPDLSSRLASGLTLTLKPLSDDQLLKVLIDRSNHLGLDLTPAVGRYIITRSTRNLETLMPLLDRLDAASLASQRRLTIPFIKSHLRMAS